MNPCNVVIRKILLSHRRLFLDGGLLGRRSALFSNGGRAVGAPVLASGHHSVPCFTSHLIRLVHDTYWCNYHCVDLLRVNMLFVAACYFIEILFNAVLIDEI